MNNETETQNSPQDVSKYLRSLPKDVVGKAVMDYYNLPYPIGHYYMPVPTFDLVSEQQAYDYQLLPESSFDLSRIAAQLDEFKPYAHDMSKIPDYWDLHRLGLGLGYGEVEGLAYYAFVRSIMPSAILEIGAGLSTHYATLGLEDAGHPCKRIAIEPYPTDTFRAYCHKKNIQLIARPLQALCLKELCGVLDTNSIVFVDSTHVVRVDGELHRILLQLLPNLAVGTWVHFHDIFLPHAILPPTWLSKDSLIWTENIALACFLRQNPHWEIVHPGYWLAEHHMDLMKQAFFKLKTTNQAGSAFWMQLSRSPEKLSHP